MLAPPIAILVELLVLVRTSLLPTMLALDTCRAGQRVNLRFHRRRVIASGNCDRVPVDHNIAGAWPMSATNIG